MGAGLHTRTFHCPRKSNIDHRGCQNDTLQSGCPKSVSMIPAMNSADLPMYTTTVADGNFLKTSQSVYPTIVFFIEDFHAVIDLKHTCNDPGLLPMPGRDKWIL